QFASGICIGSRQGRVRAETAMKQRMLAIVMFALWTTAAAAQQPVHFPSLEPTAPVLDGYLFRPAGAGPYPALVFLHGCGGLISRSTGRINTREADWAARFSAAGYVVLMVDSLGPRNHGGMCSP